MVELIYCLGLAVVAAGVGLRILRWIGPRCHSLAEELSFSLGLGFGALALGVMTLGLTHLLYESALYLLVLTYAFLGRNQLQGLVGRLRGRVGYFPVPVGSFYFWVLALVGLGILFNLTRALTPAHGAVDPLAYHLALPKIYLQKHALSFEPTLTGALYPSNIGMLFTLGIGLRGSILAQVLHFALGMCCLFFITSFCRRYFDRGVGLLAAAIFSFSPVLVFFAAKAYVDAGQCFFQFLAFWALFNWLEQKDEKTLLLAGLFTGLALGAKHPALPTLVLGGALIGAAGLFRKVDFKTVLRQGLLFGGAALLLVGPWYIRSFIEAGNPVWPLGNVLFDGLPYRGTFSTGSVSASAPEAVVSLPSSERVLSLLYWCATSLWHWSWMNPEQIDWQRTIGIYHIAFLPGLLVYARHRRILFLAGFCLLYYLIMVLRVDGNPRYSMFFLAYLSILSGFAAKHMFQALRSRLRVLVQVGFAFTLVCNLALSYLLAQVAIDYFISDQSREQFTIQREGNYRVFRQVNQNLPASSVVLLQGIVKGFYCDRPYLWDHPHQMVINYGEYDTPQKLIKRMRQLRISHIVRMINIPPIRTGIGYPQYFADPMHETFRKEYLTLLYRDESYALFEVAYPASVPEEPEESDGPSS